MCGKKYLVLFLSLFLVASPVFCGSFGWSFFNGSKAESSISVDKVEIPTIEVNEAIAEVALVESVDLVMAEQSAPTQEVTTITSVEGEPNLLKYLEANEAGMTKISQRLTEYEESSILNKNKVMDQLMLDYAGLEKDVEASNMGMEQAMSLLDDYDLALSEVNKFHFGIGISGIFNVVDGYSGYVDASIRKNNVALTLGVGYPVDLDVFTVPFEVEKINYKVGMTWEF